MVKVKYTLDEQINALGNTVTRLIKIEVRAFDRGIELSDDFRNHILAMRYALKTLENIKTIKTSILGIVKT